LYLGEAGSVEFVQTARIGRPSKLPDGSRRAFAVPRHRVLVAGVMAPAAWLLAGCGSSGGDLISTVALPSQQTTGYADGTDMPMAADAGRMSGSPELTPAQKDYLGALAAAGMHPSSELRALSIGAYVCQARAAGQSDQTVWDSVAPMVRSDVIAAPAAAAVAAPAASPQTPPPVAMDDNSVVSNVIRIATGRLC
jgi:hypothetical protein